LIKNKRIDLFLEVIKRKLLVKMRRQVQLLQIFSNKT